MNIQTKYDIGDSVKIKSCVEKIDKIVNAEIDRIILYKSHGELCIKYSMQYLQGGEVFRRDKWEEDLIKEDLMCSAMPQLLVVEIDKEAET